MSKFKKFYLTAVVIWFVFFVFLTLLSDELMELGIVATMIITFPSGFILEMIYSWLVSFLGLLKYGTFIDFIFVPLALFFNYLQWICIIKLYKRIKLN